MEKNAFGKIQESPTAESSLLEKFTVRYEIHEAFFTHLNGFGGVGFDGLQFCDDLVGPFFRLHQKHFQILYHLWPLIQLYFQVSIGQVDLTVKTLLVSQLVIGVF